MPQEAGIPPVEPAQRLGRYRRKTTAGLREMLEKHRGQVVSAGREAGSGKMEQIGS